MKICSEEINKHILSCIHLNNRNRKILALQKAKSNWHKINYKAYILNYKETIDQVKKIYIAKDATEKKCQN